MESVLLSTGIKEVDLILGGYARGINLIYGCAGSGKSTFCLIFAKEMSRKKVVYMYGGHISMERIRQILSDKELSNINFLKINSLYDIQKFLSRFNPEQADIHNIIIDGISDAYHRDSDTLGFIDANQLLKECAELMHNKKDIPILLTTQVYDNLGVGITPLCGWAFKEYAIRRIYLDKREHFNIMHSGSHEIRFIIDDTGIKVI